MNLQDKLCAITQNGLSKNERDLIFDNPSNAFDIILYKRIEEADEIIEREMNNKVRFLVALELDKNDRYKKIK